MLSLERNSYQFSKGTPPPLPIYLCFLDTNQPSGKNVIHISSIRVPSPPPFTSAFSLPTTPPQRKRNSYQFNKGTIPLPFYPCFLPTHHPSGKNVIHISFNNKGTIPHPVYLCFLAFFSLYP